MYGKLVKLKCDLTTIARFVIQLSYQLSYVWLVKNALVQNPQMCYHKEKTGKAVCK